MSDDRLELPLFRSPPPDRPRSGGEGPVEDPPPHWREEGASPTAGNEPFVVEHLEVDSAESPAGPQPPEPDQPAGIGARLAAGIIDLGAQIAVAALLVGGSALLGARVGVEQAAPLAIVVLLFSFLYHVVPLAFWGHTPGMTVTGIRARTLDDRPLSLPQATTRWLALILTVATAGLGVLLALGGRSLADRLSGSQTLLH